MPISEGDPEKNVVEVGYLVLVTGNQRNMWMEVWAYTHICKHTIPYQAQAGKGSHSWRCLHDQAKAKRETTSIMIQVQDTDFQEALFSSPLQFLGYRDVRNSFFFFLNAFIDF